MLTFYRPKDIEYCEADARPAGGDWHKAVALICTATKNHKRKDGSGTGKRVRVIQQAGSIHRITLIGLGEEGEERAARRELLDGCRDGGVKKTRLSYCWARIVKAEHA